MVRKFLFIYKNALIKKLGFREGMQEVVLL
jgi:hypothetical protein